MIKVKFWSFIDIKYRGLHIVTLAPLTMSAVDNTFWLQTDKKLGMCDIHVERKISVMDEMKR